MKRFTISTPEIEPPPAPTVPTVLTNAAKPSSSSERL